MKVCFNALFLASQAIFFTEFSIDECFFVEYKEDTQLVPKNSSVIVKLVPLVQIPVIQQQATQTVPPTKATVLTASQTKTSASKVVSEED